METSDAIAGVAVIISLVALALSWYWHNKNVALTSEANRIAKQALAIQEKQDRQLDADRRARTQARVYPLHIDRRGRIAFKNDGPGVAYNVMVRLREGDFLKCSTVVSSVDSGQTSYAVGLTPSDAADEIDRELIANRDSPSTAARVLWSHADDSRGDSGWMSIGRG